VSTPQHLMQLINYAELSLMCIAFLAPLMTEVNITTSERNH